MSTREQLNAYLAQLERRLRLGALMSGGAIVLGAALAAAFATSALGVLMISTFAASSSAANASTRLKSP